MGRLAPVRGDTGYLALRQEVVGVLEAGKEQARQAVESVRVETYSRVGEMIDTHLLASKDRADYGERVMERLSEDVGLSASLLYDALGLYRSFGILHARRELGWTHYRKLLRLPNQKERRAFRQAAIKNGWSVKELEAQIKADATSRGASAEQIASESGDLPARIPRLVAKRGELGLGKVIDEEGLLSIDVGFKDGPPLPDEYVGVLKPGDTVRAIQNVDTDGGYRLERTTAKRGNYTFAARVQRVIDGDTLWARIDFGMNWTSRKKLRLRGIDAPEIKTEAGKRAKAHLEEVLREAQPFVITTTKVDLYDRYLTDVYVQAGERDLQKVAREGRFLNRELVEEGFARRWTKEKPPDF
jgi:endonuclease YncB( thermonuclease family)